MDYERRHAEFTRHPVAPNWGLIAAASSVLHCNRISNASLVRKGVATAQQGMQCYSFLLPGGGAGIILSETQVRIMVLLEKGRTGKSGWPCTQCRGY